MRAAKVDKSQGQYINGLRTIGCSVCVLSMLGEGRPDLLVGFVDGRNIPVNILIEIKEIKGRLTPAQIAWHGEWRGFVLICREAQQAMNIIRTMQVISYAEVVSDMSLVVDYREASISNLPFRG